jgi:hypothetical protein
MEGSLNSKLGSWTYELGGAQELRSCCQTAI